MIRKYEMYKKGTKRKCKENLWFNIGLNNYNPNLKLIALMSVLDISKDAAELSRWRFFQDSFNSFYKDFLETLLLYSGTFDIFNCPDLFSHFVAVP